MSDVDFVQFLLIWTGDYNGMVDGVMGPQTEKAIRTYLLRRFGRLPSSVTDQHTQALIEDAGDGIARSGFSLRRDPSLDVTFGLPEALLQRTESNGSFRRTFRSLDNTAELEVAYLRNEYVSLDQLYRKLTSVSGRQVSYSTFRSNWFVLNGRDRDRVFYVRYHSSGKDIRGFAISYPATRKAEFERVVVAMSNVFRPSAKASDPLVAFLDSLSAPNEGAPARPPVYTDQPTPDYSGSGFAISSEGTIVTNAHVVEGCKSIEVDNFGTATLLTADLDRDLAMLRLYGRKPTSIAQIQTRPPELGQEVVILGYPLSDLMGNALSVTTGLVSSLSGFGGNQASYTLTANIQPGNSGGPVLDRNGNLVGVAVSKLDEARMLEASGTTGANIGFAISGKTLLEFLAPFKTSTTAMRSEDELSVQAIAARAKNFTVQVICRH